MVKFRTFPNALVPPHYGGRSVERLLFNLRGGMSGRRGINLSEAIDKKLIKNAKKYPVEKAKGKHTKYNKL